MVKHIFRLKIKNQLDKTHSILGLQCVANEVIEGNLARWLSVLKGNECQIPRVVCLIWTWTWNPIAPPGWNCPLKRLPMTSLAV